MKPAFRHLDNGRVYLPVDVLRAFGWDEETVLLVEPDQDNKRVVISQYPKVK